MSQKRILVAVEDQGMSQDVNEFLCAHSWTDEAEFMLVHVLEPAGLMQHQIEGAKQAHEHGEALLHAFAERIKEKTNCKTHIKLVEGRPVEQVLDQIRNWNPDLLVVGSHGRPAVARWFVGSVSLALLTQASCPITIMRPPRENDAKYNPLAVSVPKDADLKSGDGIASANNILLAVENYEQSEALVDQMTNHHWRSGTQFKVAYVVDSSKLHDTGFGADENSYDKRASYGKKLVTFVADKIRQAVPGSSIEEVVLDGLPVQILLSEAAEWPADLLVVGSHGRSPAATWFLGSVSLPLLSQASCAVMIVRPAMAEAH